MKKYNIKKPNDTQEKKKRKMTDVHCRGEQVLEFLSFFARKIL